MAEVKWIKITTTMFEDEKIDFIESLPEADSILIIWVKLLTQAGKCNSNGFIFLTEQIPYTFDMLAHKFRKPINVIKLAISTLVNLEMIEMDQQGYINIANWEKHQNIEGLDKIREQSRLRKAKQRERDKQLLLENGHCHVTSHATVTECHAIELELEQELELDIDIKQQQESSCSNLIKEVDIDLKNNDISKISKVFEENGFGTLNITVKDMLVTLLEDYSAEWIIEALKIAVKNNKRTLRYVEGILQNWRAGGGMKLESDKPKDNNPKKFDRRTKFHTAVSITDGYTAEDLNKRVDDIAEKKKQALRDKNNNK